jgi:hypothetical protein
MNLTSTEIIKKLSDKLLTQTIMTQTIIDLLIDKGIFTTSEFDDNLTNNITDLEDMVVNNHDLLNNVADFLKDDFDKLSEPQSEEDSVMSGIYYGPHGEA